RIRIARSLIFTGLLGRDLAARLGRRHHGGTFRLLGILGGGGFGLELFFLRLGRELRLGQLFDLGAFLMDLCFRGGLGHRLGVLDRLGGDLLRGGLLGWRAFGSGGFCRRLFGGLGRFLGVGRFGH